MHSLPFYFTITPTGGQYSVVLSSPPLLSPPRPVSTPFRARESKLLYSWQVVAVVLNILINLSLGDIVLLNGVFLSHSREEGLREGDVVEGLREGEELGTQGGRKCNRVLCGLRGRGNEREGRRLKEREKNGSEGEGEREREGCGRSYGMGRE